MGATLSRDEYEELVCRGVPDEYPKSTEQAVSELRARGYDVRVPVLDYLIRKGKVAPNRSGRNYEWSKEDIDRAAEECEDQQLFKPSTWCAVVLGISEAQRIRALREAVEQVNREFGGAVVGEDPDLFLMHYHPPRLNEDGYVWFELCPDICQQLEAKYGKPKGRKGGRK